MIAKTLLYIALLFTAVPLNSLGQGYPIIKTYKAEEYGGGIQIWDINIDKNGLIYFANNAGISVFDGTEWKHFTNQKQSHIRCMVRTNDGKLFTGGSSDFGYFEPDEKGNLQYHSLNDTTLNFSDIWSMAHNEHGVYFAVSGGVFHYDFNTFRQVIKTKHVVYVFTIRDKVFAHIGTKGIYEIKNNILERLPGLNMVNNEKYAKLIPYQNQKFFIVGEETGVWMYNDEKRYNDTTHILTKINTVIDKAIKEELISQAHYDSLNQVLYIATAQSVYGIKPDGTLNIVLNHKTGLPDINVICSKTDRLGNLWVGCNSGSAFVHVASPLRIIDSRMNLMGHPFNHIFTSKYSYFTNIAGLYYIETDSLFSPYPTKLKMLFEHPLGAWALLKGNNKITVSLTSSIREIENNKLSPKSYGNLTAYTLNYLSSQKQILFIGGSEGAWMLIKSPKEKIIKIREIIGSVIQSFQVKENQIVGEVAFLGIFNLIVNPQSPENYTFEWIAPGKYMNQKAVPLKFQNDILIAHNNQLSKAIFDQSGRLDSIVKDQRFEKLIEIKASPIKILPDSSGNAVYVLSQLGVLLLTPNNDQNIKEISKPFRIIPRGFALDEYRNNLVIPTIRGVCFFDLNKKSPDTIPYGTTIAYVISNKDTLFHGFQTLNNSPITITQPVSFNNNNIHFTFSSPYIFYQDSVTYECYLDGYDKTWINLGSKNQKEYTNLPYGEYTFYVRAKNIYQNYSIPASVQFTIATPWFATWMAKMLFLILGILSILLIIKIYTIRLKLHNKRLEQIVEQRTLQIEQHLKNIQEQNKKIVEQNQKISEQAKHLKEINQQLSQLSVVAESTENGVIVFNRSFEIQYINNGAIHLLGIDSSNLNKHEIHSIANHHLSLIKPKVMQVLKDNLSVSFETLINTVQHERKWIQITLSPIFDEEKTINQIVAICTDITALKIAEEEISQQQEELIAQSELLESINVELEKANQMMRDSINYAQRIQTSMLPDLAPLKEEVEDTFIFYKPKDIVSGDFYWYKKVHDVHIMVMADCTGHGVPGAFMSMIGQTLLKETIQGHLVLEPEMILNELNQSIHSILRQNIKSEEIQDDGIDMTICVYLPSDNLLRIAFANHFAYLISEGEISRIEGDIFSVGGQFSSRLDHKFSVQELFVNKGDALYLFTDGFHDQLGGEKHSKYSTSRFEELLKRIHKLPVEDQIDILSDEFSHWRGNRKQTDDITLWGIRF